VPLMSI